VAIIAGWTSTSKDSHTAVINVRCFPLRLAGGAEDEAVETVTVFYQDFSDHRAAEAELMRWKREHIMEDGGVPPESASLAAQTPPLTVNRIEGLNELRVLGTPFKLDTISGPAWEEWRRETVLIEDAGVEKEIGMISFGITSNPDRNLWFSVINIETTPISGWGSHQIMTVHQGESQTREECISDLEGHWQTLKFKKKNVKRTKYPTVGFRVPQQTSALINHVK
jgi:hypothetical protein